MNPILLALDLGDLAAAERLARAIKPHIGGYKVGLELMMSEGPESVSRIARLGLPVFADAKLHDIPNTAAAAARALAAHGARWVTAHASGGGRMLEAVADGLADRAGLLAVTVLTSLEDEDVTISGLSAVSAQVEDFVAVAASSGAEGVVCAVHEAAMVKELAADLIVVTPGIRLEGDERDDQRRVATPEEAVGSGADLIVVGRAITGAPDPVASAAEIADRVRRIRPV